MIVGQWDYTTLLVIPDIVPTLLCDFDVLGNLRCVNYGGSPLIYRRNDLTPMSRIYKILTYPIAAFKARLELYRKIQDGSPTMFLGRLSLLYTCFLPNLHNWEYRWVERRKVRYDARVLRKTMKNKL